MLAVGQDFSFVIQKDRLAAMRLTSFGHLFDDLKALKSQVEIIRLVRRFKLQDSPVLDSLACQQDPEEYKTKAVELLLLGIPYQDMGEDEDGYFIYPELVGLNGLWEDDVDTTLSSDPPLPYNSLFNFMLFLLEPDYASSYFSLNRKFYKWPFKKFPEFPAETFWEVDQEEAKNYLINAGYEFMCGTIDYFFGGPDTVFFNLTPEDTELRMPVNKETILRLRNEWKLAAPTLNAFNAATEAVTKDPQLIAAFYNALLYGLAKGKEGTK